MRFRRPLFAVASWLVVGLPLQAADAPAKESGKSFDSPQAVFDAAQAARDKNEFKTFVDCLAPEAQKQFASSLAFGALNQQSAAQGDAKLKEQFKLILAVLDKNGLTYDVTKKIEIDPNPEGVAKARRAVGALIKEPTAFAADMMEAYSKTEPFNQKPPGDPPVPKLADVKIDGDKATGTVVVSFNNMEVRQPTEFVKVGGGWKIAPMAELPPPAKDK